MNFIDISHVLDENTPVFPGDFKTSLSACKTLAADHYTTYLLQSCLHVGTHVDVPMHLINDDRAVSDFLPGDFAGKGLLLDVRGEKTIAMKPSYERLVTRQSVVLLFTGFDKFYFQNEYFASHPTLSPCLADFLISREIKILGFDMPSPDHSPFILHKKLLQNNIFILENLTNLQRLIGLENFEVLALPLKIRAEASLVRAVCIPL